MLDEVKSEYQDSDSTLKKPSEYLGFLRKLETFEREAWKHDGGILSFQNMTTQKLNEMKFNLVSKHNCSTLNAAHFQTVFGTSPISVAFLEELMKYKAVEIKLR